MQPELSTLKRSTHDTRIRILAVVCVWWALSQLPSLAPLGLSYRWHIAVVVGLWGAFLFASGSGDLSEGASRLCRFAFFFVLSGALSIFDSVLASYSSLRLGAVVLLFSFSIFGGAVIFSEPRRMLGGLVCMLAYTAISLAIIVFSGVGESLNLSDDSYRFQGTSTLKATGVAGAIVAAVPILLWCIKYYYRRYPMLFQGIVVYVLVLLLATKAKMAVGSILVVLPASIVALRSTTIEKGGMMVFMALLFAGIYVSNSADARRVLRLENDAGVSSDVTTGRAERWGILLKRGLEEAPLLGKGVGMSRYHHLPDNEVLDNQDKQKVAHNEHFAVFYELGILGLLVFWGMLGCIIRAGAFIWKKPLGFYRDALVVVFISWCGSLLDTMSHDAYLTVGNATAFIFWLKGTMVVCGASLLAGRRLLW